MNAWQILEVFLMEGLLCHSPRFSSALKTLKNPDKGEANDRQWK